MLERRSSPYEIQHVIVFVSFSSEESLLIIYWEKGGVEAVISPFENSNNIYIFKTRSMIYLIRTVNNSASIQNRKRKIRGIQIQLESWSIQIVLQWVGFHQIEFLIRLLRCFQKRVLPLSIGNLPVPQIILAM